MKQLLLFLTTVLPITVLSQAQPDLGASFTAELLGDTPRVVINEFSYTHPFGNRMDFVELLNTDGIAHDLSDFTLYFFDGSNNIYMQLDDPILFGMLQPGERFLIGSTNGVANPDVTPFSEVFENIVSDSGAITLLHSNVGPIDRVSYGVALPGNYETAPIIVSDDGSSMKSFSRIGDGGDAGVNELDFQLVCMTPGSENLMDTTCATGLQLKLNELSEDGTDIKIELYNPESSTVPLDGYRVGLIHDWLEPTVYHELSGEVGPMGYQVVTIPNASLWEVAVLLISPNGTDQTAIDAFTAGVLLVDVPTPEGSVSDPDTSNAYSWSRIPNGQDTDDNSTDFSYVCSTFGSANVNTTDCQTAIGNSEQSSIRVFPNPSNGVFQLDLTAFRNSDIRIQVFGLSGRLIVSERFSSGQQTLNLTGFGSGIYQLRITAGSEIHTQRLVVK